MLQGLNLKLSGTIDHHHHHYYPQGAGVTIIKGTEKYCVRQIGTLYPRPTHKII
jgi:hypothetical protein